MFRMIKKIFLGSIIIPITLMTVLLLGLLINPDLLLYSPIEKFGLLEKPELTIEKNNTRYIGHSIYDDEKKCVILYINGEIDGNVANKNNFLIKFRNEEDEYIFENIKVTGSLGVPTLLEIPISKEFYDKTKVIVLNYSTLTYYIYKTEL